ncbi:MAG: hypothetical protein PPP56_13625 [Longimonas sp.]|uniref:hypothetical protein n=1 Tax=Longimonas sp. TaxID=2039626 RepID=UPI003354AEBD
MDIAIGLGILVLGALLVIYGGGWWVGRMLARYDSAITEEGLPGAGRLIGYAERTLILVFVLVSAPAAIGFLVTAKSIFRFDSMQRGRAHAEYIIIGTLLSFAYAVVLSYGIRLGLQVSGMF